jgi:hypothetical protein
MLIMIDVKQVIFAKSWGNKLMERLIDAGIEVISLDNLDEVRAIKYVGSKRMWQLRKYLAWYGKYERYLVERTNQHELYRMDDGKVIIRFNLEFNNGFTVNKVVAKPSSSDVVEGRLFGEYNDRLVSFSFRVSSASCWMENMSIPRALQAVFKRTREVTLQK